MEKDRDIVLFKTSDETVNLPVSIQDETVWLNKEQIGELFQRERTVISKHIKNIYKENELEEKATCAKFAQVQEEGNRVITRFSEYYNLDVIISVGYRVKSKRGVEFRKWANNVLKNYIIQGYAQNQSVLKQLGKAIRIGDRVAERLDGRQVLDVIKQYTLALDLLDDYDHQKIRKPEGQKTVYILNYEECRTVIEGMKFGAESKLFGHEKDDSFKSSISAIYQSFDDQDCYPSLEEKAANLLYFVIKNHSFSDGNKRIAAAIFLYFLDKNESLFINGEKVISDNMIVAITLMIAESKPNEKETMINLVMNFLIQNGH